MKLCQRSHESYNKSDVTYGWNGYMNGLTVFHMNPQEKCHREEHSYPLVPGKETMARKPSNQPVQETLSRDDFRKKD